jgi:hypothetical protein
MTLDKKQTQFVEESLHGDTHVILTGKAGCGKSTALSAAVKAAQAAQMDVVVMCPTAMAASIHRDAGLESGTIHHALKWNPAREPLPRKLLSVCGTETKWGAVPDQNRLLVVDEASMVGLWLFEILARDLGDPERPFDGRRLVLVGDWAQLPPVVGSDEQNMAAGMSELKRFGPPDGCVLYHPIFSRRPPVAVILEETHRANGEWFEALNRLRDCSGNTSLQGLGIRPRDHLKSDEGIHMCFRRVTAHARNVACMDRLPGRGHMLQLRDGEMLLKEGCDVIVTSNRAGGGYINGSRATFAGIGEGGEVLLDDGNPLKMLADGNWGHYSGSPSAPVSIDQAYVGRQNAGRMLQRYGDLLEGDAKKWLETIMKRESEALAARFATGRIQFLPYYPILPGYAITVHRAQGMTLPGVIVEEDCFWNIAPPRLPYVALSRVADGTNVSLNGFGASSARVRPDPNYPGIIARITHWSRA